MFFVPFWAGGFEGGTVLIGLGRYEEEDGAGSSTC